MSEAEETLRAIRSGEVDAIVVAGPHGDRVFALEDANTPYRVLIEQMNEGAISLSAEGTVVYCNRRFADMVKRPLHHVIGTAFASFVMPDQRAALDMLLQMDAGGHSNGEVDFLLENSSVLPMRLSLRQLPKESVAAACIVATDMTEAKRLQQNLQLAASVFTNAKEGITITDLDGNILQVNDTFTELTGYSRDEVLGKNPRILKSGRQSRAFYGEMWQKLITLGHWTGEIWNRHKSGEAYAELLTISAVKDAAGQTKNYVALFSDITSMKKHQQQLEHIAHFDTLTNLPNRVLLADRLSQAMLQCQRHGRSLAVAFLDIDGFKMINDTHGHDVGDEVLVTFARYIKECLREGDTLARIGGDEFVAILLDLEGPHDCGPVLDRLLLGASQAMTFGAHTLNVSVSIGVTFYPQDGIDADLLLRRADHAMYLAKQAGKNRYHLFDVAQDAAIQSHHEDLKHIRQALTNNEFVLHYQPKVNMRTGKVIGAEALIRWQHPERGLLSPASFLHVFEGHPLSIDVGEWVINTALMQMSSWQDQGLDINVSVNIGARQLQQDEFSNRLRELLAAHPDIAPGCFQLEVLETSALENMDKVLGTMEACHSLGVNFALDDFGTGYSSLTYLKRLPVQMLKIDQSFVRDMINDVDDLAIVEGVIGLANIFHRQVIAEGVETKAHGDLLLRIGCELAQGYGIARPMPAADMPAWVKLWSAGAAWTA